MKYTTGHNWRLAVLVTLGVGYMHQGLAGAADIVVNRAQMNLTSIPADVPSDVTELNMNQNKLVSAILPHYGSLRCLYMEQNQLESLPDFRNVKDSLTELYLDKNKISWIDPEILGRMGKLTTLHLRENHLDVFPDVSGVPLVKLVLSENNFTALPVLTHLGETLQALLLYMNQIRNVSSTSLVALRSLKTLQLGTNDLQEFPPIGNLNKDTFHKIHLSFNNISKFSLDMVASLHELILVNLEGNPITDLPNLCYYPNPDLTVNLQSIPNTLHCDQTTPLKTWSGNLQVSGSKCAAPASLVDADISSVTVGDLTCADERCGMRILRDITELSPTFSCPYPSVVSVFPMTTLPGCAAECAIQAGCFMFGFTPQEGNRFLGTCGTTTRFELSSQIRNNSDDFSKWYHLQ